MFKVFARISKFAPVGTPAQQNANSASSCGGMDRGNSTGRSSQITSVASFARTRDGQKQYLASKEHSTPTILASKLELLVKLILKYMMPKRWLEDSTSVTKIVGTSFTGALCNSPAIQDMKDMRAFMALTANRAHAGLSRFLAEAGHHGD